MIKSLFTRENRSQNRSQVYLLFTPTDKCVSNRNLDHIRFNVIIRKQGREICADVVMTHQQEAFDPLSPINYDMIKARLKEIKKACNGKNIYYKGVDLYLRPSPEDHTDFSDLIDIHRTAMNHFNDEELWQRFVLSRVAVLCMEDCVGETPEGSPEGFMKAFDFFVNPITNDLHRVKVNGIITGYKNGTFFLSSEIRMPHQPETILKVLGAMDKDCIIVDKRFCAGLDCGKNENVMMTADDCSKSDPFLQTTLYKLPRDKIAKDKCSRMLSLLVLGIKVGSIINDHVAAACRPTAFMI